MGNSNVKPHPKPRNKKQLRWKAAVRPSPPGKPTLLQENGLLLPDIVHISWSKPEKDGGSAAIVYMVEHKKVGTPLWVRATPLPVLTTEFVVSGLDPGWRYQFRIFAENAVGISDPSEVSEPITVTLHRSSITAPKFTQELKDLVVLEHSKIEFEVHFLAQPPPCLCWFKDGFEIFGSNRVRITTLSDRSLLTIFECNAGDEGEIRCTATNRAGHTSTRAKLVIESPPYIQLPKSYQDQDGLIFEIGETIKFNVTVGGRPTPLIFWSHDGESIQNDDRHEIEYIDKTATAKIENALRVDRGEYQIKAVNKLGHEQASFLVTITDKPTPPGKARVVLTTGRSVTLSWSTPEDDGGCQIGNYIIEYYRVGWNIWLKAATSRQLSTMLGDLIEGSQYKFRVKAESPYGVSDPSEESETVFIPDHKRGIKNPIDVMSQIENDSRVSFDIPKRKRASSSPRVSFSVSEDTPVRPERKKTGKTPEASPRLKRKQIFPTSDRRNEEEKSSLEVASRRFSLPYVPLTPETSPRLKRKQANNDRKEIIDHNSDKLLVGLSQNLRDLEKQYQLSKNLSKEELRKEESKLNKNFSTSSLNSQLAVSFPEDKIPSPIIKDKSKTPSPEIIITEYTTDTETPTIEEVVKRSPDRNTVQRKRSFSESATDKKARNSTPTSTKSEESVADNKKISSNNNERNRPILMHQNFSGSSEFMLVLCPEGEEDTQTQKFEINFDENSVPPPLSLSAPELGLEPPEQPVMKRSASSSELLIFRLMDRINEAVMELEIERDLNKNEHRERLVSLEIPTIHVNSQPTQQFVGLGHLSSSNRRSSIGTISNNQSKWSQRRQSLRNANDFNNPAETNLSKSKESADKIKKELMNIKEQDELVKREREFQNENQLASKSFGYDESWMEGYEESISSDEETETSLEDRRSIDMFPLYRNDDDEEQETYNPTSRKISAAATDNSRPFEILTIRKEPPDSSIVPKPILKKKTAVKTSSANNNSRTTNNQRVDNISHRDFMLNTENKNKMINRQERSSSLIGPTDERFDATQIRKSPNNLRRRSFSFLPNQQESKVATGNKDVNKSKKPFANISALANSTSIAGTSVIIPEKMLGKKDAQEEAKVTADFYGDIVKNFGGKLKPTAEFSTTIIPKYDSYEERKISEIKTNRDFSPQDKQRVLALGKEEDVRNQAKSSAGSNIMSDNNYQSPLVKEQDVKSKNQVSTYRDQSSVPYYGPSENVSREFVRPNSVKDIQVRTSSKSPVRHSPQPTSNSKIIRNTPPNKNSSEMYSRMRYTPEKTHSRSASVTRKGKVCHSRDASTSPVRFENWEGKQMSRNSLEREYYGKGSLNSSRASSLSRRSLSPSKPKLREITTQTSFRIEPRTIADTLRKQEELVTSAEKRMKSVFEYFTDLAMVLVACWLYFFRNEFLSIPVLLVLVYRQLSEELRKMKLAIKKRIPNWIKKRFHSTDGEV